MDWLGGKSNRLFSKFNLIIKMKHKFISVVKNGKFQPSITKSILKVIEGKDGKKFIITIEKLSAKRSLAQNAYLHLLFTIFKDGLNDLGNDFSMERVKSLCKAKFALRDEVNEATGEIIGQYIQDTHDMNKEELNIFIENIIRWAADYFHIVLPYPNQ